MQLTCIAPPMRIVYHYFTSILMSHQFHRIICFVLFLITIHIDYNAYVYMYKERLYIIKSANMIFIALAFHK